MMTTYSDTIILIGHYTNFWPLLIWTLLPNLTFYLIVQGFQRTYATCAACQQRTLTPPDTWSCPTLGLACVLMSRPISPELVLSPDFWISNIPRYFSFAYSEDDIIKVLEFLVDNIFVVFAGKVSQQIVGIPMGTNCAPLLADIFLYWYEAEFIQSLLSSGRKQLATRSNFTYRYIDDGLSINNPEFENYLGQMYPVELEIKDTTESNTSASYLDLLLSIGRDGQLHTYIYDKRDDFNFHITNFLFLSSNILISSACGVFISQLMRYARACSSYGCFFFFWGLRDFQISFSNRDISRNAWNRH